MLANNTHDKITKNNEVQYIFIEALFKNLIFKFLVLIKKCGYKVCWYRKLLLFFKKNKFKLNL